MPIGEVAELTAILLPCYFGRLGERSTLRTETQVLPAGNDFSDGGIGPAGETDSNVAWCRSLLSVQVFTIHNEIPHNASAEFFRSAP